MIEPKNIIDSLKETIWIKPMQDELNEFEIHRVLTLIPKPQVKIIIGTRWVFRNIMNQDPIFIRNKSRPIAQGFCQLEGLDYDVIYYLVARNEAICLLQPLPPLKT